MIKFKLFKIFNLSRTKWCLAGYFNLSEVSFGFSYWRKSPFNYALHHIQISFLFWSLNLYQLIDGVPA